jgi:nucleoid-associated protein YgaU
MDQRIRLLAAATVMLVGLGLAMAFRRPTAETELPISMQTDPLVLRKQPDARTLAAAKPLPQHSPSPSPAEPSRTSPTVVTPSEQPAAPPELPRYFPAASQPFSARWGASLSEMLPETASAPPVHKVVDGDTLALLAERYLGSASRAMEIFEANRNVLEDPQVLTIGMDLKIPRAEPAATQTATTQAATVQAANMARP